MHIRESGLQPLYVILINSPRMLQREQQWERICAQLSRDVSVCPHPAMQKSCSCPRQWRECTNEATPMTSGWVDQMEKQANDELRKVAEMARLGYVLARQVPMPRGR